MIEKIGIMTDAAGSSVEYVDSIAAGVLAGENVRG